MGSEKNKRKYLLFRIGQNESNEQNALFKTALIPVYHGAGWGVPYMVSTETLLYCGCVLKALNEKQ